MDVTEVMYADKAYVGIANVLARLNLRRTEDDEHGRLVRLQINRLNNAALALKMLYGHASKIIPPVNYEKR